ncbi:hypothetical protein COB52_03335 [Candidatus Kaiserbacteria bacterium]|nr:MAG: hypothetical protein COB52_03335 [Candidatus Kaiserbacteria bacterium]
MQPTLFIFELKDGKWHSIPVEKLGTEYYLLDGFLAANFLNNIYRCDSNEDQRKYLTDAGIFIGEEEPVLM